MALASELLKRLGQMPEQRRSEFLRRLRSAAEGGAPLSFRQEQLSAAAALDPGQAAHGLAFGYRLRGDLDVAALAAAVDAVFERHEVLRSVFLERDGTPVQVPVAHRPFEPRVEDLRHLDQRGARAQLAAALRKQVREGFDFEQGPMVRLQLLRVADDEHVLLWSTHSMVFDAESAVLVLHELADAYAARRDGGQRPPAPPASYGDYARWQRAWVEGEEARGVLAGWRETLAGWQATELPLDRRRPARLDLSSAVAGRPLPAGAVAGAAALARSMDVREESVGLAAYAVLVSRYARQTDLLLGVPLRATLADGSAAPVGSYGTLVPVRLDLGGEPSFEVVVERTDAALGGALARSRVPFELVLDAAGASGDLARLSLVRLGFTYRRQAAPVRTAAGVELALERFPVSVAGFELLLSVDAGASRAEAEYATALFDEGSVARLVERFGRVLDAAVGAPATPHRRLRLLAGEERRQVVVEWNRTERPGRPELAHAVVAEQAARRPDATALVDAAGETTYGELAALASRLANRLHRAGVGPEGRVAILLQRSRRMIPAVLGTLQAGAAYVPIDPSLPAERIATILADCAAGVVLTDAALVERVPPGPWQVVDLDAGAAAIEALPAASPDVDVAPENAAYVIYTSGSTGRPKGVVVEHRNVTNFVRTVQRMFEIGPGDRITQFFSLGFDVSVFEVFAALASGARLYVVGDEERLSLEALSGVLEDQAISVADLPPALMELLDPQRLPALRVAFVGLEAFSGELATRWAAGGRRFYNGYGPTETTVAVVAKRCEGVWDASPPIGRPMDNQRAYVLDGEMEPQGAGVPGELAIAGAGVGRGYLGQPAQTAERFRPDPFGPPGSRLYLTGDLARWLPDGDLSFLGRVDRQVKVRGVRIELGEIEAALVDHDGVAQAVVEAVEDPRANRLLVAYVVGAGGAAPPAESLRAHLARKLPPPMVPTRFLPLERVPLTASGKVDARGLPPVDFTQLAGAGDDSDLRSPTERRVADQVFAPLLSLPRVGLHDHFFAMGGTSLQAFRIVPLVHEVFGVKLPLADFFQQPTVAAVAAIVDRLRSESAAGREDDLLAALAEVEGRSDAEVEELLSGRPDGERQA